MAGFPLLLSTRAQKGGEHGGGGGGGSGDAFFSLNIMMLDLILIPVCINLLESDGDKLKKHL